MRRGSQILLGPAVVTAVTIVFAALSAVTGTLARAEAAAFDFSVNMAPPPSWPADFVGIVIDEPAISRLHEHGQGAIGYDALATIWARLHALGAHTIAFDGALSTHTTPEIDERIRAELPNVLLAISVGGHSPGGAESLRESVIDVPLVAAHAINGSSLTFSLAEYSAQAAGAGHVLAKPDADGFTRRFPPMFRTRAGALPSLALLAVARQRSLDLHTIRDAGGVFRIEGLAPIPLAGDSVVMLLSPRAPAPPEVRVLELLDEDDAALSPKIAGKLALIYTDRLSDRKPTPLGPATSGGIILANQIRTLATGAAPSFPRPARVFVPMILFALLFSVPLAALAPRSLAISSLAFALLWFAAHQALFRATHICLPLVSPIAFTLACGAALTVAATWRLRHRVDAAEARADAALAPRGEIALVFTDVQGSTLLWEMHRDAMARALELLNGLLRSVLKEARGYEVKTEGDAFMLAFADPLSAAAWCLTVQTQLLAVEWPAEILATDDAREEKSAAGAAIWRGLRVRMGIHLGTPDPRVDPLTGRMDYFGPPVNKAARVSGAAYGGQIVVSGDAWRKIEPSLAQLPPAKARDLGRHFLKGLLADEQLVELLPESLSARVFAAPKVSTSPGASVS